MNTPASLLLCLQSLIRLFYPTETLEQVGVHVKLLMQAAATWGCVAIWGNRTQYLGATVRSELRGKNAEQPGGPASQLDGAGCVFTARYLITPVEPRWRVWVLGVSLSSAGFASRQTLQSWWLGSIFLKTLVCFFPLSLSGLSSPSPQRYFVF